MPCPIGPNLYRTDHKNFGLDQKNLNTGQTVKFSNKKSFMILWTVKKYFGPIDILFSGEISSTYVGILVMI